MWPNELCKGFVPDMWGIRLIEGLSALVSLVVSKRVDIEDVRRRLKGHSNHHPRKKHPQLRKSDILKVRKWLREPVQANGQLGPDHGTSTPNSVSAASSRPRRSIQQPSRLVSDIPRSSVRQSGGSAEYTSATLAVKSPPGSQQQTPSSQVPVPEPATSQGDMRLPQQPTPTASSASTMQNFVKPRPQSHTAVPLPPIPGTKSATQLQRSNSQPSASTSASNSQRSATPRTQASSQPLASPRTSATSLTPQQQSGNWSAASNPVAPQGAYSQLTSSQQSTPHHLAPSRGNKRPAESSPTASYASNTPSNASRAGAKRQRASHALPRYQPQVSRAINWDAVLPSGDEFKESLKNASDAIKPVLHKFEELLADINDEQRRLSAVQSSLFQKKNDYTNDQKKAQDALKDVEKSTANENTTLRGLEEVYQQNSGDAELRTFINKRKQTILEHKEVYVIVKSQLDKSIAGIYKTDHEIALVSKRLGQLDAERADVLKEKEGVDKAAKRVVMMFKFMEPSWQASLDVLLQCVGPEIREMPSESGTQYCKYISVV
ncbi:hypothetical protein FPRO04_13731 [Fusarium proliferatum]|nr:hypothetical protein FPRO04_13731 [Fusarium proliferatum]